MAKGGGLSNASLPIIVARYRAKLKSVVRQIKVDVYASEFERQEQGKLRQDYRLVRSREQGAEGPSPLALDLQRRLIEVERGVAGDGGEDLVAVDTSIEVDIEQEPVGEDEEWVGWEDESEFQEEDDEGDEDDGFGGDGSEDGMGGEDESEAGNEEPIVDDDVEARTRESENLSSSDYRSEKGVAGDRKSPSLDRDNMQ